VKDKIFLILLLMQDKPMFYGAPSSGFRNAQLLRENMTPAEKILWQYLRKSQLNGFKFGRQHPLKNFIADFYCHAAKLIIEVDGKIHTSRFAREYDDGRTFELEEFGIKVIRFNNDEIEKNIETVLEKIKSFLPSINTSDF